VTGAAGRPRPAFSLLLGLAAHGVMRTRLSTARIVSRVSGAAMLVIAVALLFEHL